MQNKRSAMLFFTCVPSRMTRKVGFSLSVQTTLPVNCCRKASLCTVNAPIRTTRRGVLRRLLLASAVVGIAEALQPSPVISAIQDGEILIDPAENEPEITDKVYFDFRSGDTIAFRVTLGLYGGPVCPKTVENFKTLVQEQYAGTAVYRIVPSLTIQMGDVLHNGGRTGRSAAADGKPIPPENYRVSHTIPGIVSMARDQNGNVDSRFFITTRQGDSLYLDGRYVAFGRVITGFDNLLALEKLASTANVPKNPVIIERCGIL